LNFNPNPYSSVSDHHYYIYYVVRYSNLSERIFARSDPDYQIWALPDEKLRDFHLDPEIHHAIWTANKLSVLVGEAQDV
jgi:hypothetical protein